MIDIRPWHESDASWFEEVWLSASHILGTNWKGALWRASKGSVLWVVAPHAFIEFRRAKSWTTINNIAVRPESKRSGLGRALVHALGRPVYAATDANNAESNGFYERMGFRRDSAKLGAHGMKNVWVLR